MNAVGEGSPFATLVVQWLGVAMVATFVYVLWRAHRNGENNIDLSSLLVDNGVVTLAKFGGLLALLTTTWLIVLLALKGALTDVALGAYLTAWGIVKIAGDVTNKPAPGTKSSTTIERREEGAPIPPDKPKPDAKGYMG